MTALPLTRTVGNTADTVTWTRQPDAVGYRFTVEAKVSHTWDPARTSVKVQKGKPITVETLLLGPVGVDPSTDPDPPPTGWVIEPPRSPVTKLPPSQIPMNTSSRVDYHDVETTSSTDSSVLFQGNAHGSTLKRAVLNGIAMPHQIDSRGVHGVYGKARNLTIEDVRAICGPDAESGFSLRYDGATLRRFSVEGSPPHPITYYETSKVKGVVLIEHGTVTSRHSQTSIWMYPETDFTTEIIQNFLIRDVHSTSPASALFLRADLMSGASTVRLEGCTLNGRPVRAVDVSGVPNLTIA